MSKDFIKVFQNNLPNYKKKKNNNNLLFGEEKKEGNLLK